MRWKKGQPSPNPGGRPKVHASIRAQARVDSHKAYAVLVSALDDEKQRVGAAVQILKLAGVSFQSDNEEAKTVAEAARAMVAGSPVEQLEEIAGVPSLPLN